MNSRTILTVLLSLGLIAGGGYIMSLFFGIVGVALFVLWTGGILALVFYLGGGSSSSSTNHAKQSKGARNNE